MTGLHKYGPAPLAHDGRVVDTPEVAHLKAAHLQAHAAASHGAHAIAPLGYGHGPAPIAHGLGYAGGYGKWTGPPVSIYTYIYLSLQQHKRSLQK